MVSVTFHGWLLHLWVIQQASWELVIKLVRNVPGKVYMKYIFNEYLAIIEWGGVGCEEFCRLGRMLSAEVDNIVQDLPKAELNNCFISHSKYFWFVINELTFSKTFFKTLAYFSAWFRDITYVFPWRYSSKVDNTPPAIRLTYSCISFVQLVNYSAISPSDSRERHFLFLINSTTKS